MALLLRGNTKCGICGQVIDVGQEAQSLPPLSSNQLDPLYAFGDRSFHSQCLARHALGPAATARAEWMMEALAPARRTCEVCGRLIADPDDYLVLGHFTDDPTEPLYVFNFNQMHRSCVREWKTTDRFCGLLAEMELSGRWKGDTLRQLSETIAALQDNTAG